MISPHAVVDAEVSADDVTVMEFAVVRAGARLGRGVVIHPHAVVGDGVTLGDGVEVFPGAVLGREPKGAGALARQPSFVRRIVVGANSSIGPHAVIYYDVEIGESTLIGDAASVREQVVVGSRCVVGRHVTVNYNTTIGDRTKIMDFTHITGNCRIGADCFVSVHVSSTNDNAMGRAAYGDDRVVGPTIGDGVMIGAGAVLLPGVTIGDKAVVGAGALVVRDVPAGATVIGLPMRPRDPVPASPSAPAPEPARS